MYKLQLSVSSKETRDTIIYYLEVKIMKQCITKGSQRLLYVQLKDIRFIASHTDYKLTKKMRVALNTSKNCVGDCVILFTDRSTINFFKDKSFIVDYNKCSHMSSKELGALVSSSVKTSVLISDEYKKSNTTTSKGMCQRYEELMHQIADLQRLQAAQDSGTILELSLA